MGPQGWGRCQGGLASRGRGGQGQAAVPAAPVLAPNRRRRRASPSVSLGRAGGGGRGRVHWRAGGDGVRRGALGTRAPSSDWGHRRRKKIGCLFRHRLTGSSHHTLDEAFLLLGVCPLLFGIEHMAFVGIPQAFPQIDGELAVCWLHSLFHLRHPPASCRGVSAGFHPLYVPWLRCHVLCIDYLC